MQGASPLASPGLNPSGTGAGAAYHAPTRARAGAVYHGAGANGGLHQQFIREKFLGVWGLLSRSPRTLPCHGARREEFVTGRGANAGLHQQFIREKFLGVWRLLSRSPRTLPCHGARRGRFVTGRARTADCISNSFGKVLGGLGASFKKPPTFLRIFPVIPHLRSADSMT